MDNLSSDKLSFFFFCRSGKQVTIDLNSLDEIIQLLCCGLGLVNPTYSCQEAPCKYLDLSHNSDPFVSCNETSAAMKQENYKSTEKKKPQ